MEEHKNHWAKQLELAVSTRNSSLAAFAIKNLIAIRTWVQISGASSLYCSAHPYWFGSSRSFNSSESPYRASYCSQAHIFCYDCLVALIRFYFPYLKIRGNYECPSCIAFSFPDSCVFADENSKRSFLISIVGEAQIAYEEQQYIPNFHDTSNLRTVSRPVCCSCKNNSKGLRSLSLCGHKACLDCIKRKVKSNINSNRWSCFECDLNIFHSVIYESISKDTESLMKVYNKLDLTGNHIIFCKKCKLQFEVEGEEEEVVCNKCGNKMCSQCGMMSHSGISCVEAAMGINEYKLVDITPEGHPEIYNEAKYAFDQFIGDKRKYLKTVKLVVNPELNRKYLKKKEEITKACNGADTEVYVFHGSAQKNYDPITRGGFLIGGVSQGVGVAHGTAMGYGVYSATTPDIPLGYARDSNWLLCCKGVRGNTSSTPASQPADLTKGNYHSYMSGNCIIFWSVEQVIPRFLVEFNR